MPNSKQVVILKPRARQPGGLEKYTNRIAEAFFNRGLNVTILTTGGTEQKAPPNPHFTWIETHPIRWPSFLRMEQFDSFVRTWINKHPADIVFGMDRNRIQTHIRAGNGVHQAYLASRIEAEGVWKYRICQINPQHRKILELERSAFTYKGLKKIFANSNMVKNELIRYYNVEEGKIEVIHNGVEWEEMQLDFSEWPRQRSKIAKELQLDLNRFQFLFIGNGYLRKGLDVLLRAISLMPGNDFQLSVIGKDRNVEGYKKQAVRMGLQNKVVFFGPQSNIRPFYQLADSLVIPSFYDPFANVTVEALAMGLFVVSSKSNGGHEIVNDENGTVIENLLDPDSVKASLMQALGRKKTEESARKIRNSVSSLDFSLQLCQLIDSCE